MIFNGRNNDLLFYEGSKTVFDSCPCYVGGHIDGPGHNGHG